MRRTAIATALGLVASVLLWATPSTAFPNAADESAHASFTLEACRLTAGTTLPIAGKFICPDSMYTTGNLGKSWNELDLVPHRITTSLGNQSAATTDYKISLAADGITNGKVGYDVLSAPVVNEAKSHASCSVSASATATKGTALAPFGGGTDTVIYRDVTIHQNKGTTCVFDWYQRLALTSHLYTGSSLQSYMFPGADLGGSKKTLSIPVNEIEPQSLSKDMSASQTQDYVWNVTKETDPVSVHFGDSCLPGERVSPNIAVRIAWTRTSANPSAITVITHVYATNPSARSITTTVTDRIYTGATQTTQVHPTKSGSSPTNLTETVVVPAFSTVKVIDFVGTVPAGTASSFNNVATGTYVDEVTGVVITQTTSASSSASVAVSDGPNRTATISDSESVGAGFHFAVTSVTGASGTFANGYTLNTSTVGPVVWNSGTLSGSGSVTFNKTITADAAAVVSAADDKSLHDTATLTGAGGFSATASAEVGLTSGATLTVGVDKSMQGGVTGTQTFKFDVMSGATKLDTITIPIAPPALTGSDTITTAATGASNVFTIHEQTAANWAPQSDQEVTITLPNCTGSASFNNTFGPATAKVKKVTIPSGNEAGWTFTLDGPGTPVGGEEATTTDDGYVLFTTPLEQGDYTITEAGKPGFDFTSTSGDCEFSVVYPDDADRSFACTFTNTQRGSLAVTKTVDWNGVSPDETQTFEICITGPTYPQGDCQTTDFDGGTLTWDNLLAGEYVVSESGPGSAWTVTGGDGATATVESGLQTTAQGITNARKLGSLQVTKAVDWNGVTPDEAQTFEICIIGPSYPNGNCKIVDHDGGTLTWSNLVPGNYTASETDPGTSWTVSGSPSDTIVVPTDGTTAEVVPEITNTRKLGSLKVTKAVDWNGVTPDDGQTFEICITGPSYPNGDCKTVDHDGATVTWSDLIPGDYVAAETDPGNTWTVAGNPSGTIVVPTDGGQAELVPVISNTRKLGSLQVTKNVDWNGVTPDEAQTFEICITGPSYPSGDCKTVGSDGGTLTWSNLVPGNYTASETDPGTSWSVSGSPSDTIVVPADGTTAELVPVITNTRKLGSLKVTKAVEWNGITPDEAQTFEICITGPSYPNVDCKTADHDGATLTWNNLIPGNYTATETDPGNTWTVAGSPSATIVVPTDGGLAEVHPTITNTRKLGALQITKHVDWNGVTPVEGTTFSLCIEGPSYPVADCKTVTYPDDLAQTWTNLIPGAYAITESGLGSQWSQSGDTSATVPTNGATATADVANTRKLGSLKVTKTVDWSGATPDAEMTFELCITGPSYPSGDCKSVDEDGGTRTWTDLIPGAYTVTETDPGSVWTVVVSDSPAEVPADGGEAAASVRNTLKQGKAAVVKTVRGAAPSGTQAFTFQLRTGTTLNAVGTTLETRVANAANGGNLAFTTELVPGATYQLCEANLMPGWQTSLVGFVPNGNDPTVDNSIVCVNFTAVANQTYTATVDNTPPPEGRAHTIGYWKNWASCTNSSTRKAPVLDRTLGATEPNGVVVSASSGSYPAFGATFHLVLHGNTANPDVAPSCAKAVSLLNKSTFAGKKMASDPAFNMAAQLVAAELNYAAGAEHLGSVTGAMTDAVRLLGKYKFDGTGYTGKITAADKLAMNTLAELLDDYNNNLL